MISALERENAELRAQLSALAEQLTAHFTRTIDELTQQIAKLNDRVAELTAAAQRRHQRPRGAKPTEKTAAPPPNLSAEAKDAFANRPQPPSLPPKITKQKKPRKPSGRKALPSHLPIDQTSLRPEVCDACGGGELDVADEIVEEKLHVVKEHQRRRVVRRTTCRCRKCGSRTTPRSLPAPYERSKVTCEWLAWLIHQKFSMLAPLDRVRRDLLERGIPLAMGTLVGFVERAADLLATVDGEHWKQLLASEWMATDGTGIKVLVPSLPEAHDGYIEQYRNDDVVCFQYEATKDGEIVANKLSSFEGVLTADAEHRFNGVYMSGRVIEAGCNAHGRRKFRDAEETQPILAAEGGAFISAMYVEEEKARALGLKETALLQHRQQHTRPIADAFDNWLRSVDETLLPSDLLKTAVRYYRNHREALYRFIDDARVPIDNSPTEREFQNVAKLRLNMLFAGSTEGAHRACVLLGIVASCRTARVPVEEYLAWAFERLGTHRDAYNLPAAQLTPAAFKRATTTTK